MKNLLTLIAAIAITSAATAQLNTCSIETDCGIKSYKTDTEVRVSQSGSTVTVRDKGTGMVLDTFECEPTPITTTDSNGDSVSTGGFTSGVKILDCVSNGTPTAPEVPTTPETPSLPDFSNIRSVLSSFLSRLSEEDKNRLDTALNGNLNDCTPQENRAMVRPGLGNTNTSLNGSNEDNSFFEGNTETSEGGTSSIVPTLSDDGVSVQINASAPAR